MSEKRQIRLVLWSVPRSGSTAFLRAMSNAPNSKCFQEIYPYAFFSGSDRGSPRYLNEPVVPGFSYAEVKEILEKPYPDKELVFVKSQAFALPLKFRNIETLPEGYTHTFIIREPEQTVRSFYKILAVDKKIKYWDYFSVDEVGFDDLYEVFKLVTETLGQKAVIIDHADLVKYPEHMLRQYCEAVGLEYTDKMVNWEHPPPDMEPYNMWEPEWFESVLSTTSFHPDPSAARNQPKTKITLPDYAQKIIEKSRVYYKILHEKRLRPPSE